MEASLYTSMHQPGLQLRSFGQGMHGVVPEHDYKRVFHSNSAGFGHSKNLPNTENQLHHQYDLQKIASCKLFDFPAMPNTSMRKYTKECNRSIAKHHQNGTRSVNGPFLYTQTEHELQNNKNVYLLDASDMLPRSYDEFKSGLIEELTCSSYPRQSTPTKDVLRKQTISQSTDEELDCFKNLGMQHSLQDHQMHHRTPVKNKVNEFSGNLSRQDSIRNYSNNSYKLHNEHCGNNFSTDPDKCYCNAIQAQNASSDRPISRTSKMRHFMKQSKTEKSQSDVLIGNDNGLFGYAEDTVPVLNCNSRQLTRGESFRSTGIFETSNCLYQHDARTPTHNTKSRDRDQRSKVNQYNINNYFTEKYTTDPVTDYSETARLHYKLHPDIDYNGIRLLIPQHGSQHANIGRGLSETTELTATVCNKPPIYRRQRSKGCGVEYSDVFHDSNIRKGGSSTRRNGRAHQRIQRSRECKPSRSQNDSFDGKAMNAFFERPPLIIPFCDHSSVIDVSFDEYYDDDCPNVDKYRSSHKQRTWSGDYRTYKEFNSSSSSTSGIGSLQITSTPENESSIGAPKNKKYFLGK